MEECVVLVSTFGVSRHWVESVGDTCPSGDNRHGWLTVLAKSWLYNAMTSLASVDGRRRGVDCRREVTSGAIPGSTWDVPTISGV